MEHYYCPKNNTEKIIGLHDLFGCTKKKDMPQASKIFFERHARDGYEWKCLNGKWPEEVPIPPPTPEEQEKQKHAQWKAARQAKVDAIVVEIDGMTFDGDETSQARMARAGALAESPDETIRWILADNTVAMVTAGQLLRAARAAGLEQEKLWIPEETDPQGQDIQQPTGNKSGG